MAGHSFFLCCLPIDANVHVKRILCSSYFSSTQHEKVSDSSHFQTAIRTMQAAPSAFAALSREKSLARSRACGTATCTTSTNSSQQRKGTRQKSRRDLGHSLSPCEMRTCGKSIRGGGGGKIHAATVHSPRTPHSPNSKQNLNPAESHM